MAAEAALILVVDKLLTTYVGPEQLWVIGRVKVADNLTDGQVTQLGRGLRPISPPGPISCTGWMWCPTAAVTQ